MWVRANDSSQLDEENFWANFPRHQENDCKIFHSRVQFYLLFIADDVKIQEKNEEEKVCPYEGDIYSVEENVKI